MKELYCTHCGFNVNADEKLPGSGWIEFVLWMAWIVPGLIYSIWRRSGSHTAECPSCGSTELIPAHSPKAAPDAPVYQVRVDETDGGVPGYMWWVLTGVAVIALIAMIPS